MKKDIQFEHIEINSQTELINVIDEILSEKGSEAYVGDTENFINFVSDNTQKLLERLWLIYKIKSIIYEDEYIERYHKIDYESFYNSFHNSPTNTCTRLHLFNRGLSITSNEEGSIIDLNEEHYIGSLNIRNLEGMPIASAFLKPINGNDFHYTTLVKNKNNIKGFVWSFENVIWIPSDQMVGACATVSLFIVNYIMGKKFGLPSYAQSEITNFATKYATTGRNMPNEGLTNAQILSAFDQIGIEPIFHFFVEDEEMNEEQGKLASEIIYSYNESGFPILLGLYEKGSVTDGHAVVVLGHKRKLDSIVQKKKLFGFRKRNSNDPINIGTLITNYKIHNDSGSPYEDVVIRYDEEERQMCCLTIDKRKWLIKSMFIPLLKKDMQISYKNIRERIKNFFMLLIEMKQMENLKTFLNTIDIEEICNLKYRTFLVPSNWYKTYVYYNERIDDVIKEEILNIHMSKFIWLTEIFKNIEEEHEQSLVSGCILFNASGWVEDQSIFLFFHYKENYVTSARTIKDEEEFSGDVYKSAEKFLLYENGAIIEKFDDKFNSYDRFKIESKGEYSFKNNAKN